MRAARWSHKQYATTRQGKAEAAAKPHVTTADAIAPYRSKLEMSFAVEILPAWVKAGKITGWSHEAMAVVLGGQGRDCTRYTPDFVVFGLDGHHVSLIEVKGPMASQRDDAKVKFRTAPDIWPCWRWYVAEGTRRGRTGPVTWDIREIKRSVGE